MSNINENAEAIAVLGKPNQKITIISAGESVFGSITLREDVVTRGIVNSSKGIKLAYGRPRSPKKYAIDTHLLNGAIVLKGHHTRKLVESNNHRFMLSGGGEGVLLFNEAGSGDGADLLEFIKSHVLCHTLDRASGITLVWDDGTTGGNYRFTRDFTAELFGVLPPPLSLTAVVAESTPEVKRHKVLSESDLRKLREADSQSMKPLIKVFDPTGASTWLLCHLGADGDTLWGYADLGFDCVEYGTISLNELETARGKHVKLPVEKDRHFTGCDYTADELMSMSSLPTSLRKRTA